MKRVLVIIAAFVLIFVFPPTAYAADEGSFPFIVEIIPPDNQITSAGYYHVPGMPGEKIIFWANLINITGQPLEIRAVAMNAYSTKDGIIYQSSSEARTQKYRLADGIYGLAQYMEFYEQIVLAPEETKEVSFTVTVPDIGPGTVLGSIRFIVFAGTDDMQQGDNPREVQILVDKYLAVDTAIQIDIPGECVPYIAADNAAFNPDTLCLDFAIENLAAVIQNNLSGSYEILGLEGDILFSGSIGAFKMAPNTIFEYSIPWQYESLEEGEYFLSLTLIIGNEPSAFILPFTIGNKQVVQAANVQAEIIRNQNKTVLIPNMGVHRNYTGFVVICCSILLLIGLFIFSLAQKRDVRLQKSVKTQGSY